MGQKNWGRDICMITEKIPEYKSDFLGRNFFKIFSYGYKIGLLNFQGTVSGSGT